MEPPRSMKPGQPIELAPTDDVSHQSSSFPPAALRAEAMAAETVVLKVAMSCEGCAGAVRRVLSKMEGVETFDIDLKEQKVTVKGNVKPEDVFQTVSKSGKKTSYWEGEAPAPAPAASAPAAEAAPSTEAEAPAAQAAPEITPAKTDA